MDEKAARQVVRDGRGFNGYVAFNRQAGSGGLGPLIATPPTRRDTGTRRLDVFIVHDPAEGNHANPADDTIV